MFNPLTHSASTLRTRMEFNPSNGTAVLGINYTRFNLQGITSVSDSVDSLKLQHPANFGLMAAAHREMDDYKPQPGRVDHQQQSLSSTQGNGFTFVPFPKIPRPRQGPPPIPERRQQPLTYGQGTMDVHHKTHKSQHSQGETTSSTVSNNSNSRSHRAANAATLFDIEAAANLYNQVEEPHKCSKCHGIILASGLSEDGVPESVPAGKGDTSWNYIYPFYHPALQRNNSIGGFTLTGQDSQKSTKGWLSKVCSSHKIALVVSTFSFLVTIGLTITLILMKNKGMMEPM